MSHIGREAALQMLERSRKVAEELTRAHAAIQKEIVVRHREILAVLASLRARIEAAEAFRTRTCWGRLRWLLRGR